MNVLSLQSRPILRQRIFWDLNLNGTLHSAAYLLPLQISRFSTVALYGRDYNIEYIRI